MLLRNFLFHRVSDEKDVMWPPMKPMLFKHIIKHLTNNYLVVPLENYLTDPSLYKSEKRIATVLFDDGYKDNIQYAAPILNQFNCPASFYIVTDCIDRNIPTWTYLLDNCFQHTKKRVVNLPYDFVPEILKVINFNQSQKFTNVKLVKPWVKSLTNIQREQVMEEILRQCDDVSVPQDKMMSWNDVKQLDRNGFAIGSHSHTHPMLAQLSSENEIYDELKISYQRIFEETGKPPLSISYPIGSFDKRVMRIAREVGFLYGLAVGQKFFHFNQEDYFEIPRMELYQESWGQSFLRLNGIHSFIKGLWK